MSFTQLCDKSKHELSHNGKLLDFIPNIEVIAFSLCHINRFNGHVGAYSVAQHSILVYHNMTCLYPENFKLRLSALLHDATEAYIGDMTSPLKALMPEYVAVEQHYHDVIDKNFDIETRSDEVKKVDLKMLATEARSFGLDLIVERLDEQGIYPYPFDIKKTKPDETYVEFMAIYNYLSEKHHG